ncbi:wings apart-like protein 2 [Tasmannia lanceolata]|uniref:wings apart-like protein 2 n=1 Tax=Tasmannia lanceolata TaxID=3420 RepID=UPI0040644062
MIVRTYGRRNRGITRSYSDSVFNGEETLQESLSQESSQEIYGLPFSSQDSSSWSLDSDLCDSFSILPPRPNSKKSRNQEYRNRNSTNPNSYTNPNSSISKGETSTLMEAQEFGEMMEHVDEVNFALDGLRLGQPSRIRRASLLSLLSICMTPQQRRLLRTQGMAKKVIDAILGLSFDDPSSTLAASALFYVLASDGQDEHLLDSPSCIHFLIKLLNPPMPDTLVDKAPSIGCKLLSVNRDPCVSRNITNRLDSSSTSIISKVLEILLSCKEIRPGNGVDDGMRRPELNSKWITLLTMEKACLSAVSLEDTSGTVRRVGGNFKERLRELGGLDAIFDLAASCHSIMEGWLKHSVPPFRELKDDVASQTVALLLKCLKIMENATFLSKDNQNHLLGMNVQSVCDGSSSSFVGLIISAIKILSGLSLIQDSSAISNSEASGDGYGILATNSSGRCCSTERLSQSNGFKASIKLHSLSTSQSELSVSGSEATTASRSDVYSITKEDNSPAPISCKATLTVSNGGVSMYSNKSKMDSFGLGKRHRVPRDIKSESLEDSQDPFAFDEDELEPSKWELLKMKKPASRTHQSKARGKQLENGWELQLVTTNNTLTNGENRHTCENSSSSVVEEEEEASNLLGDCLLTAVKVLMNLTNDNPVGCQKIAACGGLDTMAALIIGHFPLFESHVSSDSQMKENISFSKLKVIDLDHQSSKHLSDWELDFLVAILGLLVNLVEKDDQNRSRLATASVPLPSSRGSEETESRRDVVPLLCSIFLANQGAGEAAEEGKLLPCNDEAALLQGEREAEKMIIEAYSALLLAFLSTESLNVREAIAGCLPGCNLEVLVPVLERFVAFHLTLNMISPETHATVSEVIESCRGP